MSNNFKLERGMLVSYNDLEWYIVVDILYNKNEVILGCLCDHANNRYFFKPSEIKYYLSVNELKNFGYNSYPDREFGRLPKRGIPYEEILEIMLGGQDDLFADYL